MCACDSHKAFSLLSLVKSNSDTTQKSLNSWKKNAQPNCSEWIFHWGWAQILNMAPEPDQNSFYCHWNVTFYNTKPHSSKVSAFWWSGENIYSGDISSAKPKTHNTNVIFNKAQSNFLIPFHPSLGRNIALFPSDDLCGTHVLYHTNGS